MAMLGDASINGVPALDSQMLPSRRPWQTPGGMLGTNEDPTFATSFCL
jgi:hypothetical protein